jgi:hypothetical protein
LIPVPAVRSRTERLVVVPQAAIGLGVKDMPLLSPGGRLKVREAKSRRGDGISRKHRPCPPDLSVTDRIPKYLSQLAVLSHVVKKCHQAIADVITFILHDVAVRCR